MSTKTVFIAEDEPLARESLRDAVMARSELQLIGEADNGKSRLNASINCALKSSSWTYKCLR